MFTRTIKFKGQQHRNRRRQHTHVRRHVTSNRRVPIVARVSAHSRAITLGGVIPLACVQLPRGRIKGSAIPSCCTLWLFQPSVQCHSIGVRGRKKRKRGSKPVVLRFGETLSYVRPCMLLFVRRAALRNYSNYCHRSVSPFFVSKF